MKHLLSLLQSTSSYKTGYKVLSRLTHSHLLREDVSANFYESLPKIIGNIIRTKKYLNVSGVADKIQKATEYNMRTKNNIGGVTLLHAYSMLEKAENITEKSLQQAFVLAWAVEMVHSHNLIMENTRGQVFDQAQTDIGVSSAKDADLLRSFMHLMLEEHFEGSSRYNDFLQLYNKAFVYNALAREIEYANSDAADKYRDFNEERYDLLCEYKTTYQSLKLPLLVAMKLANRTDEKAYTRVDRLCSEMGKLYQIKKDFHDCFGREVMIGTAGSDIQRDRCTWLAVTALQRFTPRQRVVFAACYGGAAPAYVERVKVLYTQVQLPQQFIELQATMLEDIKQKADEMEADGIPSSVFLKILEEIVREENASITEEPL